MGIKILNPGLLTSIQDLGRVGYQKFGISPSGALDQTALKTANLLVNNSMGEAALEMTLMGAVIEFTASNVIAVTGGNFSPTLNDSPIPLYTAIAVKAGDTLALGVAKTGCRSYIAFSGGLDVPVVMGSKSTNLKCKLGGYQGRQLRMYDEIPFAAPVETLPGLSQRIVPYYKREEKVNTLSVVLGLQTEYFTAKGMETFFGEEYTVTNRSDRMGCNLDGPVIEYQSKADIISDGIPFGGIQIPNGGKPIIMLSDRQTTGGYAKIATVISADIPLFVQRKMGDKIRFKEVSIEQAQEIYTEEASKLEELQKKLLHLK
jgi:antagonist of KipI